MQTESPNPAPTETKHPPMMWSQRAWLAAAMLTLVAVFLAQLATSSDLFFLSVFLWFTALGSGVVAFIGNAVFMLRYLKREFGWGVGRHDNDK